MVTGDPSVVDVNSRGAIPTDDSRLTSLEDNLSAAHGHAKVPGKHQGSLPGTAASATRRL
jgi:hypothetical protein